MLKAMKSENVNNNNMNKGYSQMMDEINMPGSAREVRNETVVANSVKRPEPS